MVPLCGPHTHAENINLLESVQRRAARCIKSKYDSTLYVDDCLKEVLKWPKLAFRRFYQNVTLL